MKGPWQLGGIVLATVLTLALIGCPRKKDPDYTLEPPPGPPPPPAKVAIHIGDSALEAVVRAAVAKPEGDLYQDELEHLTVLKARQCSITALEGIEHLTALQALDLGRNYLRDLTPLAGLTKLTELKLDDNFIADLAPLAGLTALVKLDLSLNEIKDLGPLAGLVNLTALALEDNEVTSIAPLAGLAKLSAVNLKKNRITDLMPLWEISEKGGLASGGVIMVSKNPISAPGRDVLGRLKAKGVTVEK